MKTLAGRHALVTGAGRGIGLAVATALAEHGASLTLVARTGTELEAARRRCRELGAPLVHTAAVNLTDRRALEQLARGGAARADIVINNAGSAPSAPLERTDDVLWDASFALNAFAPFALCRAALPPMVERGFGRIVNVASTAALKGFAYTVAYTASKHALLGATRALSAELGARWPGVDVTVNAVCPGFVDTALVADAAERIARLTGRTVDAARARLAAMNPRGRLLAPAEVAEAIVGFVLEVPGRSRGRALEFDGQPA